MAINLNKGSEDEQKKEDGSEGSSSGGHGGPSLSKKPGLNLSKGAETPAASGGTSDAPESRKPSLNLKKDEKDSGISGSAPSETPARKGSLNLKKDAPQENASTDPVNVRQLQTEAPLETSDDGGGGRGRGMWILAFLIVGAGLAYWFMNRSAGSEGGSVSASDTTAARPEIVMENPVLQASDTSTGTSAQSSSGNSTPQSVSKGNIDMPSGNANATPTIDRTEKASAERSVLSSFSAGSASPSGMSRNEVDAIKSKLGSDPSLRIILTGYASSEGDIGTNEALGLARANAMRSYLVSMGVDAGKIEVKSGGISNPIGDNSTPDGRAKNRRVEMGFVK